MSSSASQEFRSALQVDKKRIANLTDNELEELMQQLLTAQSHLCGAPLSRALVNTEGKAKDGGADGSSGRPKRRDEWLGDRETCWQFKAGVAGEPSRLLEEVGKPRPSEALKKGKRFVVVASGSNSGEKGVEDRLKKLRQAAEELGLPTKRIKVIGSEGLANWCNQHPAIAARWANRPDWLWTQKEWASQRPHAHPWQTIASLSSPLVEYRQKLDPASVGDASCLHLHLHGPPGAGKSRLALELCRHSHWAEFLVYLQQASETTVALLTQAGREQGVRFVLVADNTPANLLIPMRDALDLCNGRVRLITIGASHSPNPRRIAELELGDLPEESIRALVGWWHPSLSDEQVRTAVDLAAGNPGLARLAADALVPKPDHSESTLRELPAIRALLEAIAGHKKPRGQNNGRNEADPKHGDPNTHATQPTQLTIGSGIHDLPNHKEGVINACFRQSMLPNLLDDSIPRNEKGRATCIRLIDEAEIYIGIFAYQYGTILAKEDASLLEIEYNRAVDREIPRLIFLIDPEHPIKIADIEQGEGQKKLEALKRRLQESETIQYFKSAKDLREQLVNKLSVYRQDTPRGVHHISDIPKPPEAYIAHPYTLLKTETLIGRQRELNMLSDWVSNPESSIYHTRILSIVAIGGMGKSALTWKWFKDIAPKKMKRLSGRIWWSFYESDAHFDNFVTRALAYVSGSSKEEVEQIALPERENRLLAVLNQKPHLIVFDGLERILNAYARMDAARLPDQYLDEQTANFVAGAYGLPNNEAPSFTAHWLRRIPDSQAHIAYFLQRLKLVRRSRILISTRLYPADLQQEDGEADVDCSSVYLDGMDDDDALALWRASKVSGSRQKLIPLFQTFGKHPLMIRLLAGAVANFRAAPGDLDQWSKNNPDFNPYKLLKVEKYKSYGRRIEDVQAHILKFALQGLDSLSREILNTVAAFRTPAFYATLVDLLVGKDKSFPDEQVLDCSLSDLQDRSLLGWDRRSNRYDLHPVVRGSTWNQLNPDIKRNIYGTLHDYYDRLLRQFREDEKIRSVDDLAPAIQQFENLVGLERNDDACELFRERLFLLRDRFLACQQRIELLESLFVDRNSLVLRALSLTNRGFVLSELADALTFLCRFSEAKELSLEAAKQYLFGFEISGVCKALSILGYAHICGGQLRKARSTLKIQLELAYEKQYVDQIQSSLFYLSQNSLAMNLDAETRLIARRLFQLDCSLTSDEVAVELALANKRYSSAMLLATRLFKSASESRNLLQEIKALHSQAIAAFYMNNDKLAWEKLSYVLTLVQESRYLSKEVAIRNTMADFYCQQGDVKKARNLLVGVWDILNQGGYQDSHIKALRILAEIEFKSGNLAEARIAACQAYEMAWAESPPYVYQEDLIQLRTVLCMLACPEPTLPQGQTEMFETIDITPSGFFVKTNTRFWDKEAILRRIQELLTILKATDSPSAQKWMQAFITENLESPTPVLHVLEQLEFCNSTVQEFFLAYVYSNTDNIQANLFYHDYVRLQKQEKESGRSSEEALELWARRHEDLNTTLELIEFLGFNSEDFEALFHSLKELIGVETAIGPAKKWWETFELMNEQRGHVVFRLAESIATRKATINDFYFAYLGSNTENIDAILSYLDYKIYREQEESKKRIQDGFDEAQEVLRQQAVAEVSNIRLLIEEEKEGRKEAPQQKIAATTNLHFRRCPSCLNLIPESLSNCPICVSDLSFEERDDESFSLEVDRWCEGLQHYPGEIFNELVFRVIQDKLKGPIEDSIRNLVILNLEDICGRLSKAAKYLIDEQQIAFYLLCCFPNPHTLDPHAQIAFARGIQKVRDFYYVDDVLFAALKTETWRVTFDSE